MQAVKRFTVLGEGERGGTLDFIWTALGWPAEELGSRCSRR